MRVVVFGGRNFRDWALLCQSLDRIRIERWPFGKLIHGAARGADLLADKWARRKGIAREPYPADWDRWATLPARSATRR